MKAVAGQVVSASQPLPSLQRPTRTSGRKRRHSDGSNVSDAPSSSQDVSEATKPIKKRRGRKAAQPEQEVIVEEEEQVMGTGNSAPPACDGPNEAQASQIEETIKVSQSSTTKKVHFGIESGDEYEGDKSTATNITPHPRSKMSIKRRATTSPLESTKRSRTSRTSLPSSLGLDGVADPGTIVQEIQYAPLQTVLQKAMRRMEEAKRQTAEQVDEDAPEEGIKDDEMLDRDMLVLDTQEELEYPQLPTAPETPISSSQTVSKTETDMHERVEPITLGAAQRAQWAGERRDLADAVVALQKQSEEARADLKVLNIELRALGFSGADSQAVLDSIREAFGRVRDNLEAILPSTLPNEANNEDMLEILVANIKEFVNHVRTADKELREKNMVVSDLSRQVHGLVEHLAEKELKNNQLSEQWKELDVENDEKAREIEVLEEDLHAVQVERDEVQTELVDKTTEAEGLQGEKTQVEKSFERLTASLQGYRDEETRLTDLIAKMEDDHRNTVTNMNKEREETVQDLENRLDAETELRAEAEGLASDRQTQIKELETQKEAIESEHDELREELETVKEERDAEMEARETAEADLENKRVEVGDLEGRVDRLEEELEELNGQIETLRQLNDTERQQRQSAEQDLDERNAEIQDLGGKLREQGQQANELRQKLFEVQMNNEQRVQELEAAASERDEQYQNDMTGEVERREDAEDLAAQRAATIQDLKHKLEEVEQRMRELFAEKDERIAELEDDVTHVNNEIKLLREDLRAEQHVLDAELEQNKERNEELEGSILALQETISERETTIRDLQRQAMEAANEHDSQMEDRNATISELNHNVAALEADKADLQAEKNGLERRVEAEAMQMLEVQNEKADEIEALKESIRDKQAKVLNVEDKARHADKVWQETLEARDVEVKTLRASTENQGQTINSLIDQNVEIKCRFRDYHRRSSGYIADLEQALYGAKAVADEKGEALRADGDAELEAIEAMDDFAEMNPGETVHVQRNAVAKKTRGRKKRNVDSGIGLGEGAVDGDSMLA